MAPTGCPHLDGGRVRNEDEIVLLNNMYAFMVSMLVRLYDRGVRLSERDRGMAVTMLEAMELDVNHSLLSSTNYAYYAGGEFGDFFFFGLDELYEADLNYSCSSGMYGFSGGKGGG